MRVTLILALLALASPTCLSREPSQLTASLISRSQAVIVAEFRDNPRVDLRSGNIYVIENFDVKATLAGEFSDSSISVHITRTLDDEPHPFKAGERLILFVKKVPNALPPWELTDDDFGIQPYTHGLESSIKQLVAR